MKQRIRPSSGLGAGGCQTLRSMSRSTSSLAFCHYGGPAILRSTEGQEFAFAVGLETAAPSYGRRTTISVPPAAPGPTPLEAQRAHIRQESARSAHRSPGLTTRTGYRRSKPWSTRRGRTHDGQEAQLGLRPRGRSRRAVHLGAGSDLVTTSKALQTQGFSITIGTLLPNKWPHCQNPTEHAANKKPRICGAFLSGRPDSNRIWGILWGTIARLYWA